MGNYKVVLAVYYNSPACNTIVFTMSSALNKISCPIGMSKLQR
jgi:hypothetical protein